MDLPAPPTNYPKSLSSIILRRRRPDARAATRHDAINNNCARQRLTRPIASPPSVHDHHSLLQLAPPGPGRDRVVARSSAVVSPPPLPPPPLPLPLEMPNRTIRRLDVASPVPADIDIANSVEPLSIVDIAYELGLGPEHYDLYGRYKAKVRS